MNDEYKFNYSYSAPNESERREIESIKKQYVSAPKKEDKLERLRDLNKRVMQPPLIISLTIGIVGTLVMGVGLTMVLEWNIVAWGVMTGILGAAIAASAYPIYKAILNRNKRKYGERIIELSDDLLNAKEESERH